ncbi:MAG: pentapeptide repeat-containing protein, partial [Rhodospirillales bacterium]|nr:pentapeptide repeat-containing protein [Rhodospirillales bacterium]
MANDEHVALIKEGRLDWNAWKVQHKEVIPDL